MPRPRRHSTDDTRFAGLFDFIFGVLHQVARVVSQIAARSIEARHVLRHDCSSQSTARSSQTVAQAVPFLRSQRAPRSSQGADFCAGGPRLTLFSSRRIADRTVADRSTLARRSRQRSTLARTLAVGSSSWLVARCRSLSRRDYLHEDRLHACKVQGA